MSLKGPTIFVAVGNLPSARRRSQERSEQLALSNAKLEQQIAERKHPEDALGQEQAEFATVMGLRISRSIVESHGRRLWAADNSPRDARFWFTLPTSGATCTCVGRFRTGTDPYLHDSVVARSSSVNGFTVCRRTQLPIE
jgi:hypothetical protein